MGAGVRLSSFSDNLLTAAIVYCLTVLAELVHVWWSSLVFKTINLLIKDVTSIGYVGQQIDTSHIRIDKKYKCQITHYELIKYVNGSQHYNPKFGSWNKSWRLEGGAMTKKTYRKNSGHSKNQIEWSRKCVIHCTDKAHLIIG